jgi:hypothetical protein
MKTRLLKKYRREASEIFWVEMDADYEAHKAIISIHYKGFPNLFTTGDKLFIKKECDYDKREELLEEMCDLCYHLQRNFILRCVYTRRFASCKYRR